MGGWWHQGQSPHHGFTLLAAGISRGAGSRAQGSPTCSLLGTLELHGDAQVAPRGEIGPRERLVLLFIQILNGLNSIYCVTPSESS